MILNGDWTKEDWRIEVSGPLTPYNVSWEFLSAPILMVPTQNISVWFEIELQDSKQLFGNGTEILTIYFDDLQVMNSYSYHFKMVNSTIDYTLYPIESINTCGIGIYTLIIHSLTLVIIVVGIIGLLVRHSMVISWQVINILQFMNFVPLMMIYTPSCVVEMLDSFAVYNTEIGAIGASLIRGIFIFKHFNNDVDYKYLRAGYNSTAFLWNAADILTVWLV